MLRCAIGGCGQEAGGTQQVAELRKGALGQLHEATAADAEDKNDNNNGVPAMIPLLRRLQSAR